MHNDHCEVDSRMDPITDSENNAERAALFDEMETKLLAHAHAEQEVLWPAASAASC